VRLIDYVLAHELARDVHLLALVVDGQIPDLAFRSLESRHVPVVERTFALRNRELDLVGMGDPPASLDEREARDIAGSNRDDEGRQRRCQEKRRRLTFSAVRWTRVHECS
jgi:hypothetical protein